MKSILGNLVFAAALAALPLTASAIDHVVTVNASGFTYSPQTVNANVGDTITFTKAAGAFAHNVASDAGAPQSFRCAVNCVGTGGDLSSAAWSSQITLTTTGTIGYHCELHGSAGSGMFGTINVTTPVDLQKFEVK
jgi:plastocyanin